MWNILNSYEDLVIVNNDSNKIYEAIDKLINRNMIKLKSEKSKFNRENIFFKLNAILIGERRNEDIVDI